MPACNKDQTMNLLPSTTASTECRRFRNILRTWLSGQPGCPEGILDFCEKISSVRVLRRLKQLFCSSSVVASEGQWPWREAEVRTGWRERERERARRGGAGSSRRRRRSRRWRRQAAAGGGRRRGRLASAGGGGAMGRRRWRQPGWAME